MPGTPTRVILRTDGQYFAAPDKWVTPIEHATHFVSAAEAATVITATPDNFHDCILLYCYGHNLQPSLLAAPPTPAPPLPGRVAAQ